MPVLLSFGIIKEKMKKTIIISGLLLLCLQVSAQTVSKEAAQQKAVQFLNQHRAASMTKLKKADMVLAPVNVISLSGEKRLQRSDKATSSSQGKTNTPYYIFNASDGQGYVIVSGDARAREVLGYSDVGSINENDIPENLQALLGYYAEEMEYLISNPTLNSSKVKRSVNRTTVPALLSSKWNQNTPYNYYCPSGCPTGCVATAMAQILYYWAKKGNDIKASDIPGYITTTNKRNMSALSATSFAWDLMTNSYSSTVGESGKAVAKLMQYCGTALKMDYTSGGSNAWGADQVPAMTNYFGMDKGMKYIHRPDFTFEEWDDMMYKEMSEGRPVLYGGCGYQSGWGGHAFVMDGYNATTDTYHFNFGWGGSSDGYFTLTALGPSGYDFNAYVDAVILIQPNKNTHEEETPFKMSVVDITNSGSASFSRDNRADDFEGISIFNAIFDYMNLTTEIDLGLGLFNETGEMVDLLAMKHIGNYEPQDGFGLEFCFDNLSFGAELPYGKYYIKAISKESNSDIWLVNGRSERHYIEVDLEEKTLQLVPSVNLVISSFSNGKAKVKNLGKEEATSNLYIFRNEKLLTSVQEAIPADGNVHDVSFSYFSGSTSNIKICSDKYGRNILYSNNSSGNISVDGFVDNVNGSAKHIDPFLQLRKSAYTDGLWSVVDNENTVIGNRLSVHLFVTNKDLERTYNTPLQVVLYRGNTTDKTSSIPCEIAPGETKELLCTFDNLIYGSSYSIQIMKNGTGLTSSPTGIIYKPTRGIVVYKANGSYDCISDADIISYQVPNDVVCVDVSWTEAINELRHSENPNCIYLLPAEASIPDVLKGKNVVIGNQAENINLCEGYDFGSPLYFVANSISFSRLIKERYDGNEIQWGSLCLPFSVDEITVDGKPIDWFHNSNETGKNLWVMNYVEDDGKNNLCFDHAQSIVAYRPYLITAATEHWGEEWQLTDKIVVFQGHNASIRAMKNAETVDYPKGVSSSMRYDIIGRNMQYCLSDCFSLNGKMFSYINNESNANPFEAYVVDYLGMNENVETDLQIVIKGGEMGSPISSFSLLGDVNGDGEVDVTDVALVTSHILGTTPANFIEAVADLNGDGEIDVTDIALITQIILTTL